MRRRSQLIASVLAALLCSVFAACESLPKADPAFPNTLRYTPPNRPPAAFMENFVTTAPATASSGGGYSAAPVAMLSQAAELWTTNQPEAPGFAQYTYILLVRETGATPEEISAARARNLALLHVVLAGHDTSQKVIEGGTPRERINLELVPVTADVPYDPEQDFAAAIYARYDFNRAQAMLTQRLGLSPAAGPYLVSSAAPLWSSPTQRVAPIVQDLSGAPPTMIVPWWRSFASKASSPRFWTKGAGDLRLSIRQTLEQLAQHVDGASAGIKFLLAQINLGGGEKP